MYEKEAKNAGQTCEIYIVNLKILNFRIYQF